MKIAVLIMSTKTQPSVRNIEAFKESVVRYYNDNKDRFAHEYDFYEYYSSGTENEEPPVITKTGDHYYEISINEMESVYTTYEKTYRAFGAIDYEKYDLFVRINISLWLNMDLLDAVADQFLKDHVYCNAINSHVNVTSEYVNDIYPRGDMYIFGQPTMEGVLKNGVKYMYCDRALRNRIGVEHVDDCLVGICLIDTYGKDYYKHIDGLRYIFSPRESIYVDNHALIDNYSVGFRVKTVPDGQCSGYSWDDNEYRLKDGKKMRELREYFDRNMPDYRNVKLKDILTDETNARKTLFVSAANYSIKDVFWKFLERKRQ